MTFSEGVLTGFHHGPLTRYTKLRVAHSPGMSGAFSLPLWVSDPDMHHATYMTHVPWCMSGLLTGGFLWSQWRGKRSRHSRRMRNPQFCISGKRRMVMLQTHLLVWSTHLRVWSLHSWVPVRSAHLSQLFEHRGICISPCSSTSHGVLCQISNVRYARRRWRIENTPHNIPTWLWLPRWHSKRKKRKLRKLILCLNQQHHFLNPSFQHLHQDQL